MDLAEPHSGEPTEGLRAEARIAAEEAADRLARSVAKARIANALFARDRRVTIGRYQLLERVGAGGMGVVWGAWDPELERRVALKLVKPTVGTARDRILREGQALAKLSHPNIVPIFDVGVLEDQVYLVMEWVRGTTLRRFGEVARTPREVVEVYRQAGAGLAAAHRASVIHRDFKPDNAIYGEDGRVRVLDFGLASASADQGSGAIAGTPRYMAPEQASDGAVTAAADQFSFCVSLREALTASAPRWITSIVERGTAVDPAARFPTMDDLVAALGRDPARRWRRRGLAIGAALAAVIAFVIGGARSASPPRCVGGEAELARSWNPGSRRAMEDHLRGLGPFGANESDRLAGELDAYGAAWVAERTRTCMAHERGALPPALYERRVSCLARVEVALATAVEVMTEVANDKLGNALIAARSLPSAAGCADADVLGAPPPPAAVAVRVADIGREVERARVLSLAASPRAIEVADAAAVAAQATRYEPLIARALLTQGWARATTDRASARDQLFRAFHMAVRAGDDLLAVEAYARARWVASRAADFHPADGEREVVEDLGGRNGAPGRFGLALLYNNLASERLVADDREGARDLLRRALETWSPPLGDRAHDIELIVVLRNLALVEDDPARRVELSVHAADRYGRELGGDHPATINARIQAAVLTPGPGPAAARFAETCDGIPAWHASLQIGCAYEHGWLAIDRADTATAAAAMTRAQGDRTLPDRRPQSEIASAYLDVASGDPARVDAATRAMRTLAATSGAAAGWWNHADAADALVVAAIGDDARGRAAASTGAWAEALALLAEQPALERRRARAHAMLAERWFRTRPDEARVHAAAAVAWYQAAGGYDAELERLRRNQAPVAP